MPHTERDPRIVPGVIIQMHKDIPYNMRHAKSTRVLVLDTFPLERHGKYIRDQVESGYRKELDLNDIIVIAIDAHTERNFNMYWRDFWNPLRRCRNASKVWGYMSQLNSKWFDFVEMRYGNPLIAPSNRIAASHLRLEHPFLRRPLPIPKEEDYASDDDGRHGECLCEEVLQ